MHATLASGDTALWAATQTNLGNTLATLGARESGTARLEQTVAAFTAALGERTRERVPLDWAGTQFNLDTLHLVWFDKIGEVAHLDTAEGHVRAATEVFAQAGASHYLGMAERRLADIARRRQAPGP